ncbi:MAG: Mov34/MPN/PAD-1 family protein [Myxococcota bacterium]|nr:Mov34/MPN/PAD-1 family protein [Myxococcota bacterium]
MGRRVDVDEAAEAIEMPPAVLHELYAHAREALPEECCGLVLGDERSRFERTVRCRNDMNRKHSEDPVGFPRDARTGFWMSEVDTQRALEEADREGQRVTAVYHSHVDVDAFLSEMDLEYADPGVFPGAAQIVIAVSEGQVKRVALFQREGAEQPFRGHPVVSEAT